MTLPTIDVRSASPFPVSSLVWHRQEGGSFLTILCKATLLLSPYQASIAREQQPIFDVDVHTTDLPGASLVAPTDRAPEKPRVDVMLVGHAYAPGPQPVQSLRARLSVGPLDKVVEVFCDRVVRRDGAMQAGAPFRRMPLRYERAAGGPGTANPAGMPHEWTPQGLLHLPNIAPAGARADAADPVAPAGFGPISPSWPARLDRLGHHPAPRALHVTREPLPAGFDMAYFNAAPPDQQLDELHGVVRLSLEHLHPDVPRLVTELPAIRPVAEIEGLDRGKTRLSLRCDTVWIDTDRAICTLTFRGVRALPLGAEAARVVLHASVQDDDEDEPPPSVTRDFDLGTIGGSGRAPLPFSLGGGTLRSGAASGPGLPFTLGAPPPSGTAQPAFFSSAATHSTPEPAPFASTPTPPAPAPPPGTAPAAYVPVPPGLVGALPADLRPHDEGAPPEPPGDEPAGVSEPSGPALPPSTMTEGDILDLIWFDPDSVPRVRRRRSWRELLDQIERMPIDPELDAPELSFTPADVENRRDISAILTRVEPLRPDAAREVLAEGVYQGAFSPKAALFAGELSMPWDEITHLRALVIAATPLSTEDERLRAALRAAGDFLAIPGLFGAPAVADGLAARIREILRQGRRAVSPEIIEMHAERAALEQRGYQRRVVFGGPHLKGLLRGAPNGPAAPVYLPERIAADLPLFQRFRARLIVEVHPPVEQQETFPAAFRALAVARVLPATAA